MLALAVTWLSPFEAGRIFSRSSGQVQSAAGLTGWVRMSLADGYFAGRS